MLNVCFKPKKLVPDQGYCWVMLFASCVLMFMVFGVHYTFGILYPSLLKEFDQGEGKTGKLFILNTFYYRSHRFESYVHYNKQRQLAVPIIYMMLLWFGYDYGYALELLYCQKLSQEENFAVSQFFRKIAKLNSTKS